MALYNALPRKEYERVFMCQTAKAVWHTLIITQQGNSQIKDYKIDIFTQQYEKFSILSKETIDNGFTRFNAIVTGLKSLDQEYSRKNHSVKIHDKFDICKEKTKGGESSRRGCGCYNYGNKNQFIGDCPKPRWNKAVIEEAWSNKEDGNEPSNDATYLMAIDSQELGKNNEATMALYNALPRKEYERVFMCQTAKAVWHTLIITQQGNSQIKDYKIDIFTQQYEKFSILSKETIDNGFTRFNAIVTGLKSLDQEYSRKNHSVKIHDKFDICKEKTKGGESSRRGCGCYNYGNKNQFIGDCPKPRWNKAVIEEAWSNKEDGNEPSNDATYLMAIDSQEV
nr:zf-CCHC domain-containing protein/DUF4219 domain-containing protein/UBN2 domain-containing protein [Tanacetum cinerariifolium]